MKVLRNHHGSLHAPGAKELDNAGPARCFDDYAVRIDGDGLPEGGGIAGTRLTGGRIPTLAPDPATEDAPLIHFPPCSTTCSARDNAR